MKNLENKSINYIGDSNSSTLIFLNMNSNKIFILGIKILTIILTALLNGILIYIFGFSIKKKSFSNLIFLSIAISDFIIGSLSMTSQVILDNFEEWPFDKFSCLTSVYIQYAIPDTTILALLILAMHRYIQLKSHNVSEKINKLNLIKLFSAWIIPTSFWIGSICFFIVNNQFSTKKCNIEPSIKFKAIKVTLFGLLPLFSIIVLNILLMKGLNKKGKRFSSKRKIKKKEMDKEDTNSLIENQPVKTYTLVNNMVDAEHDYQHNHHDHNQITVSFNVVHSKRLKPHKRSINKDRRAFICIFALTLSIFCTQIIYLIMWPMPRLKNLEFLVNIFYKIGVWLSYLTSLTNPILLCFFHEKVKQEIYKFLPKCS